MTTDKNELDHEFFSKIENVIKIIKATGELFISVHLFDLKDNKLIAIKSNERISKLSEKFTTAQDIVTFVMESLSVPETLESIKEFTTLQSLPERLKDQKIIAQLFQGRYLGWCNTMFIKLDEEDPIRYVLCVVQSVDKDIKRITELKKKAKENSKLHSIVDGLMAEYTTVCSVNLENENVEFLRTSEKSKQVLETGNIEPKYKKIIEYYTNIGIYTKDRQIAKEFFSLDNLKSIEEGSSKSIIYRNEAGEYGETKLIRTADKYVLVGFTEKNKEIEEMQQRIFTDSLTGVKNRKYYDEEITNQKSQALVMTDVDYFKMVNDRYGHQVGDKVLEEVAKTLQSCIRKTDEIIRYGGDEFVISFNKITKEALELMLEKMRRKIEKIQIENYPDIKLSMSFGAVVGNAKVEDMITQADEALYESKEQRNMITIKPYKKAKVLQYKKTEN